ncbi:SKAP2 protein, partial [Baryphthengus martii]|nr:SKAP2 protein [Baryphthengus martii]
GNQFHPVAAKDLEFVLKAGYLEKRRKEYSLLGFEWQKLWCVISKTVFYYYGSDKDKQQKGEFAIEGYTIRMNNNLRKDAKKDCCFEVLAPDKRIYQFTAASPKEAEEWVQQIKFVIQDTESNTIPEEEEEEEEKEEEEYDDVGQMNSESVHGEAKDAVFFADCRNINYANFYRALWDCTGDQSDELTFKRADVIQVVSKEHDEYGWWIGEMEGNIGFVPKAYLMEMYDI